MPEIPSIPISVFNVQPLVDRLSDEIWVHECVNAEASVRKTKVIKQNNKADFFLFILDPYICKYHHTASLDADPHQHLEFSQYYSIILIKTVA